MGTGANRRYSFSVMSVPQAKPRLAARNAPDLPGVYFFYGDNRQILYIGKAISLRKRLLQHFPAIDRVSSRPSRQQVAAAATETACWIVTESELHALVLEDEPIKRHIPITNKQYKKFLLQEYIGLADSNPPHLFSFAAKGPVPDKVIQCYGPFSDEYVIKEVLEIGRRYCGLDDGGFYLDSEHPGSEVFLAFLAASDDRIFECIKSAMKKFASCNQFELAAKARDHLVFCEKYLSRQRFFRKFRGSYLAVQCRDGGGQTWLFLHGKLIIYRAELISLDELHLQPRTSESGELEADWMLFDRAKVVRSWLNKNRASCEYWFEPDRAN